MQKEKFPLCLFENYEGPRWTKIRTRGNDFSKQQIEQNQLLIF
jgi:hypothetical protein